MKKQDDFEITNVAASASEFVALREACGWGHIPVQVAQRAIAASVLDASVRRNGKLLACGRIVGDGVLYFYVQDVIVVPEARGLGIGGLIMERLMTRVHDIAPVGATIGLMSATGKEGFYERFGFAPRPAKNYGAGMTQIVL